MSEPAKEQAPQWALDAAAEYFNYSRRRIYTARDVAELFTSHHAASQRWIPCAASLPQDGQQIFFSLKRGGVIYGYFRVPLLIVGGIPYEIGEVTHWMPAPALPEPPSATEGAK